MEKSNFVVNGLGTAQEPYAWMNGVYRGLLGKDEGSVCTGHRNTLLWSDTIEGATFPAVQWLDICGRNGIILNPDKFVFSASTVVVAGFTITMIDVRPYTRYIEAICDFPEPRRL